MPDSKYRVSTGAKPLEDAIHEFIDEHDGNYAKNLERVLEKWQKWCAERDVYTLEDVSTRTMASYAKHLNRRVEAKQADPSTGITASSAQTYYNYVSAFLSWADRWSIIPENPAAHPDAQANLPDDTKSKSGEQQFWTPEQRRTIVEYVDERAQAAIDEKGMDAVEEVRDRALVTVLAYTGVRGAEVLADSRDHRRVGLRWHAVDLEDGTIRVRGKSQETEDVGLPGQTIQPLRQLRRIVDPPADGWPVFPSRHPPSLYAHIEAAGYEKPDGDPWGFVLEKGIEPPSMTTSGARTLLKRLSKEAAVPDLDLEVGEYLTLHGARRGVGETLYREVGHEHAQRTLRHADPKTTSEMYSHIEASELAEENTEVFDAE